MFREKKTFPSLYLTGAIHEADQLKIGPVCRVLLMLLAEKKQWGFAAKAVPSATAEVDSW